MGVDGGRTRVVEQPTRHITNKPVITRVPETHIHSFIVLLPEEGHTTTQHNTTQHKDKWTSLRRRMKATKRPIHALTTWVRRQPPKMKAFLAVVAGLATLLFLRMVVHDHDNLFIAAEFVHALGISLLIFKLTKEKTCAGRYHLPNPIPSFYRIWNHFIYLRKKKNITPTSQIRVLLSWACGLSLFITLWCS